MRIKMNYFFTDKHTPSTPIISDFQRRAVWIALALIFQALNEIDHNYYLPILKQFTSLPPLLLLTGSFYALWMAIRPESPSPHTSSIPPHTTQHPQRWQRIVLLLTFILTIPGIIQIGYTTFICFTPPVFTNDGTSLDTNAASLLLAGRNPYT